MTNEIQAVIIIDGVATNWKTAGEFMEEIDGLVEETEDHYVNWYEYDARQVTEGTVICTEDEFDQILQVCWRDKYMIKEVRMEIPYANEKASRMEE